MALDTVSAYFQDTDVPINFTVWLSFAGRDVPANSDNSSHVGVEFYLSSHAMYQDEILTAVRDNPLDAPLQQALYPGWAGEVRGQSSVHISSAQCAGTLYLCVKYVFLTDLTPPFRELTATRDNDKLCVNITEMLACHDGKYSL